MIQKLDDVGLTLNYSKFKVQQSSVEFLGCRISSEDIAPLDDKVSAVMSMDLKSQDDLQKFLGIAQCYARFIPNLSSMTTDLRKMIQSDEKNRSWSQKAIDEVNAMKQAIVCS